MSINPQQRKVLSLEKLNTLRSKVCQAYSISNGGDELQIPKNKNSVYYSELKEDIFLKTKKKISEGTLLKFFHDDNNRSYQIIIISAIEEYIDEILSSIKSSNESIEMVKAEIREFGKRIYIELSMRKAGIPIDAEKDVIEEVYNSWYQLFCLIREELKTLPPDCFKELDNPDPIVSLTTKILNEILRPHLTEHQAKFKNWLMNEKKVNKKAQLSPQVLQKDYPLYETLTKSIKATNIQLMGVMREIQGLL